MPVVPPKMGRACGGRMTTRRTQTPPGGDAGGVSLSVPNGGIGTGGQAASGALFEDVMETAIEDC